MSEVGVKELSYLFISIYIIFNISILKEWKPLPGPVGPWQIGENLDYGDIFSQIGLALTPALTTA